MSFTIKMFIIPLLNKLLAMTMHVATYNLVPYIDYLTTTYVYNT